MALVVHARFWPRRAHARHPISHHPSLPHISYLHPKYLSYRTYHRDRNLYNRVMGLGPDMDQYAVGINEARHWHRRAYGGLVSRLIIYL